MVGKHLLSVYIKERVVLAGLFDREGVLTSCTSSVEFSISATRNPYNTNFSTKQQPKFLPTQLKLTEIRLQNLHEEDATHVLEDLLYMNGDSKAKAQQLAECVHGKTAGNPFYMKQYLMSLQKNELLTFYFGTCSWWRSARSWGRGWFDTAGQRRRQ